MPSLFDTFNLRSVTMRNRIAVSAMCQFSAEEDGSATDWHLVHLGARAVGGAGLITTEMTAIEQDGRLSDQDLGIYSDLHIGPLQKIVDFVHQNGSVIAIQLGHAGRKAFTSTKGERVPKSLIGASPIPFHEGWTIPTEVKQSDIDDIITHFINAAIRSEKAGFDGIQIHAAHGYLIHQFLSPLSNHRHDEYGGNFKNRIRLLETIIKEVRQAISQETFITVRLSCTDWIDGGWDIIQSVKLSKILKDLGVDLIDCSSGGISPLQNIPVGAGYQIPFSETIKREANIQTSSVGMITTPNLADEIIRNNRADIVTIGREELRDPYFPLHAATELGIDLKYWPKQYSLAKPKVV